MLPNGTLWVAGEPFDDGELDPFVSHDGGATWAQLADAADHREPGRMRDDLRHACVVALASGEMVAVGDTTREVLRSAPSDLGRTWQVVTALAPWENIPGHACVAVPPASTSSGAALGTLAPTNRTLLVFGGLVSDTPVLSVWLSTDAGATWRLQTRAGPVATSHWAWHRATTMPTGTIVALHQVDTTRDYNLPMDHPRNRQAPPELWTSNDLGVSWTKHVIDTATCGGSLGVTNDTVLLTSTNAGCASGDGGATWHRWPAPAARIEWLPRDHHTMATLANGTIVVMGGNNILSEISDVWRSDDGGSTWYEVTAATLWNRAQHARPYIMSNGTVFVAAYFLHQEGWELWRSDDNGTHWRLAHDSWGGGSTWSVWLGGSSHATKTPPLPWSACTGTVFGNDTVLCLFVDDTHPVLAFADGTSKRVTTLSANLATEEPVANRCPIVVPLHSGSVLVIVGCPRPVNGYPLATAGHSPARVMRSDDGGESWALVPLPRDAAWHLPRRREASGTALANASAVGGSTVVVMGGWVPESPYPYTPLHDVWVSHDAGAHWECVAPASVVPWAPGPGLPLVAVGAPAASTLVALEPRDMFHDASSPATRVWCSRDGGHSWVLGASHTWAPQYVHGDWPWYGEQAEEFAEYRVDVEAIPGASAALVFLSNEYDDNRDITYMPEVWLLELQAHACMQEA